MTYLRNHTIHFRGRNGRRGSVIVLVVAVLALLAVIGTVYIVSARSERSSAVSGSVAENLDLAQQAIDKEIVQIIDAPMHDARGDIAGRQASGQFGGGRARTHDMPELNVVSDATAYDNTEHEQSWLVSNVYRTSAFGNLPYVYNDLTMPQTRNLYPDETTPNGPKVHLIPSVYNPEDGFYDLPIFTKNQGAGTVTPVAFSDANNTGLFRVVSDPLPPGTGNDAVIQMLPFSEANGTRYRFGLRIVDTSSMANLNVTLPTTGAAGNYSNQSQLYGTYSNSYSLTNTNIFNSTKTSNGSGPADAPASIYDGRMIAPASGGWQLPANQPWGYAWQFASYRFEEPSLLAISPYDLTDELELRALGMTGTMASPRSAAMWPNNLGNRAANSAVVSAGTLTPLSNNRPYYTTYSYSRDVRRFADPLDPTTHVRNDYQVMSGDGQWLSNVSPRGVAPTNSYVWPPYPAKVNALPDISGYVTSTYPPTNNDYRFMADTLAITATNLATAVREAGFADTVQAYAANYLTSRWSGWVPMNPQPTGANVPVYYLKSGPSYVDQNGLHFRTVGDDNDGATNGNSRLAFDYTTNNTLTTPSLGTKVFVGYAAQPFLNEVAIQSHKEDPVPPETDPKIIEDDAAIELYNPYNVAISLDDFQIIVHGVTIDFTTHNMWVPARGFFVITNVKAKLDSAPTLIPATTRVKSVDASTLGAGSITIKDADTIILQRKYYEADGTTSHWATVDRMDVTAIANPQPADSNPKFDFEARANSDSGNIVYPDTEIARWVASANPATYIKHTHGADGTLTLGAPNSSDSAITQIVPLYDRTLEMCAQNPYGADNAQIRNYRRLIPQNVADFNRIMRVCSEVNSTPDGMPTGNDTITTQMAALSSGGSGQFPADSRIHFDFSDSAAAKMLEYITFTDRVSDYSVDLGDNDKFITQNLGAGLVPFYSQGISKLRIPGKINVNTASPEVLSTIPVINNNLEMFAAILCYRWRTINDGTDTRIPGALRTTGGRQQYDFRLSPSGYGITSMAELQIPIAAYQAANNLTPSTINERDQLWAALYNSLTVRSDTFVVYAYLEAIRQNPRYTLAFNNSSIWYANNPSFPLNAGITDDPSNSSSPLLRVGRRRWVAIVDRSMANYSRTLPDPTGISPVPVLDSRFVQARIVAEKDMPR